MLQVDDREFRWLIRKKPTYSQVAGFETMMLAIELVSDAPVGVLIVNTKLYRPDTPGKEHQTAVTPGKVRSMIEFAIETGWNPEEKGTTHIDFQLIREQN